MRMTWLLIALLAGNDEPAAVAPVVEADAATQVQTEADETARFARDEADQWELFVEGTKRTKLELRRDSILRWSNPAVGRVYGSVFVWTSGGRPAAVASLYKWYSPYTQRTAEFVSLSTAALAAERRQRKLWAPAAGQVKFQPIPGAAAPDESSKRRPAQMRSLARGFVPELTDRRLVDEGTRQQLRLLDKPLYQYGAGAGSVLEGEVLEGGLFAFVVGTDPEVLLLIEARETKAGREWHYALVRMNRDAVRVNYMDREVWSVPYLENPLADSRAPYHLIDIGLLAAENTEK
jgi:hypothetical protein